MGMNIYTLNGEHIGKRYAAGVWCWDCKVKTNYSKGYIAGITPKKVYMPFTCPNCGQKADEIDFNPAYRELGFDKSKPKKHSGIDGASGFTWHGKTIDEAKKRLNRKRFVKTEYGDKWTVKKFWRMFDDILPEKTLDREFC